MFEMIKSHLIFAKTIKYKNSETERLRKEKREKETHIVLN